jgi:hypothetical protein
MARGVPITQEKIRARKRKRRLWRFIGIFSFLALLIAGMSFVSSLNAFQIKHIEIIGMSDKDVSAAESITERSLGGEAFGLFPRSDIFFVSTKTIAADILAAFPSAARVSVSKRFFDTLVVDIQEKTPAALWCLDATCDKLDASGAAFQPASSAETSAALVFGNGAIPHVGMSPLPSSSFVPLLIFMHDLPERGVSASSAAIGQDSEVRVYVATSTYLIVDPTKDLSKSLANLDRLFMDKSSGISAATISSLQYVDLRFPDKVFYK